MPPVDVLHLHHGVLANVTATPEERDWGGGQGELLLAAGEEKTTTILPPGYGYEYLASGTWAINDMVHNLTPDPDQVWLTYDIGFVPKTAPEAADLTPARPLWMDVQKGMIYPVFDVLEGSGSDGEYTSPDDADDPYGLGIVRNEWLARDDDVLIAFGGHLYPGGKSVDLWLRRDGEETDELVDATELADGPLAGNTSCAPPCDRSTGVAYPLADADVQFDSRELGNAGPPTAGRLEWEVPTDLAPDTSTYFCRIHPSMRGAFRVVE